VKGNNGLKPENLTKKKLGVFNKDVAVFVFFFLLSFILWYINSLGRVIESDIRYPVIFTNLPKDRVVSGRSNSRMILSLKGPGYTLMKIKFAGRRNHVNIDISKVNYRRVPGSKELNYYFITSGLEKSLAIQLRTGCEITSIRPDTLFFTLSKSPSKSVN